MTQHRSVIRIVFLLAAGCLLAACSGKALVTSDNMNIKGMPDWVIKGTRASKDDGHWVIHGVRMASLADLSMQRPFATHEHNLPPVQIMPWGYLSPAPQPNNTRNDLPPISAATLGNISEQGPAADDRARAEVARVLSTMLDKLSKNYSAPEDKVMSKAEMAQQIKGVVGAMLKSVRIVARWRDEQSNYLYSLAELDMTQAKGMIRHAEGLDTHLREYIETEIDNVVVARSDK